MKKSPNRKRYENVAVWCNFLLFNEIFLILGVFVKGLYKILQRKFRPEKMTLFFLLFISPKRLSQKMPHRPEVRRFAPQVRIVFHFYSTFCINLFFLVFFQVLSALIVFVNFLRSTRNGLFVKKYFDLSFFVYR